MKNIKISRFSIALLLLGLSLGCTREDDVRPATFPATAEVFIDGFSAGLEYAAFGDSKLTAFEVDDQVSYENLVGSTSMRFDIPNVNDPEGSYAGGIFRDLGGRDLTGYDALTFYAYGSKNGTVDLVGFGTDFMEDKYAAITSIKLTSAWKKYTIPLPDPSVLTQEKGLFAFAEGPEDGEGYSVWIDVVKFEKLGTVAQPRPAIMNGQNVQQKTFIGVNATVSGLSQTFNLGDGTNQTVLVGPAYFSFTSSDPAVATVDAAGIVKVVGQGTTTITATLGDVDAAGSLTIESLGEFTTAPVPVRDAANVISIFSDAYDNVPVDFYNGYFAPFQTTQGQDDIDIDGDKIIKYTELNFVATEFKNPTVNATDMTHFHVDIQIENDIAPGDFVKIQLGDFGADGVFGGDNDVSGTYQINTAPPLVSNQWISLDIPLTDFSGLTQKAHLAQIFFITDGTATDLPGTITDILVDNMYFYKDDGGGGGNCQAETTQSLDAADFNLTFQTDPGSVIGSFGGNYSYSTNPDSENAVNQSCQVGKISRDGQQFANTQLDFTAKFDFNTNAGFKMKVWTPTAGTNVLLKLEDKTNSAINTEVSTVTTAASAWEEITFDFGSGESGKYDKIILFFELNSSVVETYYIDDFRLYGTGGGGGGGEPATAAPTPTVDAANVVSIYSDAYTDIAFDNFDAGWCGGAAVTPVSIAGDNALKKNTGVDCHGIDFSTSRQDLSTYTHIHFDFYTNDTDLTGDVFNIKLVDFAGGAGEVSNLQVNINTGTMPAIVANSWVSVDVDITSLGGVVAGDLTRSDVAQIGITTANLTNVWYDNIYLYKSTGGGGATTPTTAAPTPPTRDAANVVSIFSDAYTNITSINLNPNWGQTTQVSEELVGGNNTLKYMDFNYQGTDFSGNAQNVSTMEFLHVDMWTADATDVKVTPINGAGSPAESLQGLTPITAGQWVSYDIPLSAFTASGMTLDQVVQMKFDGQAGTTPSNIWLDNIYFYKANGGGGGTGEPTTAAPTPTVDAANVVSIYSDAYTDIAIDNFDAGWCGGAAVTPVVIDGNNALKKNTGVDCHGIDFSTNRQDLSTYTHIHFDFFTNDTNLTGDVFNVKLVDFAGGAGEASALEVNINTGTIPGIVAGTWVSVDIDITALGGIVTGNLNRSDIAQIGITTANLTNVWYDNIYLYK